MAFNGLLSLKSENVCNSGCDWDAIAADQEAPTATCGDRITWLQDNRGLDAAAACNQVAGEFPTPCGSCAEGSLSKLGEIGAAVFLPEENIKGKIAHKTTHQFFVQDDATCITTENYEVGTRKFDTYDSMHEFIRKVSDESSVKGGYKSAVFSIKVTADVTTGYESKITTAFHSVALKIEQPAKKVQYSDKCILKKDRILPEVLDAFESLPLPDASAGDWLADNTWTEYQNFFNSHGSHIIKTNVLGSAFYQWNSVNEDTKDVTKMLKAKTCLQVTGKTEDSGTAEVAACNDYSDEDRDKSKTLETEDFRAILGGTLATRNELDNKETVQQVDLDNFLAAAKQGTEIISASYDSVWTVFEELYRVECASTKDKEACDNLQRSRLLGAAYSGFAAYDCRLLKSAGTVYQGLRYTEADANGILDVECFQKKTGCTSDSYCHGTGAACFAYGAGAFDGDVIKGTTDPTQYRTTVRTSKKDSHDQGINRSCDYRWQSADCRCNVAWAGGQGDRVIWSSASAKSTPPPEQGKL